jgi:signal transduction histidine kinase
MKNEALLIHQAINKAFPGISPEEAQKLIDRGKVACYPPGMSLCLEGKIEDIFYVILEGEVRVSKQINKSDDKLLKFLKPGEFFGEMGIIHDAPRAATVTTITDVSVLEIDKESFKNVLQQISTVSLAMVREVSRRLRENDEMAIEDLRLKAGELADAYQQLAELEMARREFLTTIAHELRTPLTSASGYVQAIKMGIVSEESLQSALETVSENLQRIIDLTNDILFLQEMDLIFSDFDLIDIHNLIDTVVEAEQPFAEENKINLYVNVDGSIPEVPGDEQSLERAFQAVINNAIKFSLDGGDVSIKLSKNENCLVVSISDTGIGIPSENIDHIFTRFWRTEEYNGHLFGGVGLGLSIAKQVIEQHGGNIEVNSALDKGSEFVIHLSLG